jgi:hypothetical protein
VCSQHDGYLRAQRTHDSVPHSDDDPGHRRSIGRYHTHHHGPEHRQRPKYSPICATYNKPVKNIARTPVFLLRDNFNFRIIGIGMERISRSRVRLSTEVIMVQRRNVCASASTVRRCFPSLGTQIPRTTTLVTGIARLRAATL